MAATRDSWRNEPMPEARERLELDLTLTDDQRANLDEGVVPGDQDDRWFVFTADDTVHIHRSWTGHEIFRARLAKTDGGWEVAEAWANRDPEQYEGGAGADARQLASMLDHLAAGGRL